MEPFSRARVRGFPELLSSPFDELHGATVATDQTVPHYNVELAAFIFTSEDSY